MDYLEFKDLREGDTLVSNREVRVGGKTLVEGTLVQVTGPLGHHDVVMGRVWDERFHDGVDIFKFHYQDLDIVEPDDGCQDSEGFKVLDVVRIQSDIPMGGKIAIEKGQIAIVVGVQSSIILCSVPGFNSAVGIHSSDLELLQKGDIPGQIRLDLDDVAEFILTNEDPKNELYIAVPVDLLTASTILTMMKYQHIFLRVRE